VYVYSVHILNTEHAFKLRLQHWEKHGKVTQSKSMECYVTTLKHETHLADDKNTECGEAFF